MFSQLGYESPEGRAHSAKNDRQDVIPVTGRCGQCIQAAPSSGAIARPEGRTDNEAQEIFGKAEYSAAEGGNGGREDRLAGPAGVAFDRRFRVLNVIDGFTKE